MEWRTPVGSRLFPLSRLLLVHRSCSPRPFVFFLPLSTLEPKILESGDDGGKIRLGVGVSGPDRGNRGKG